ncbi:helix-turn-helix domain-containing protein [Cytobacillus sp.]|uniref:helix-turn-helix domain-containing protein n=1 Tax=Cytobacillus sp. TaxID=2675269 RepID=UPI003516862B
MGIGERIKNKRKQMRLTQAELAKLVNVSAQVISNWERGYTNPNHDDVARLAEALECSTEELHGREPVKKKYTELTEKDEKDIAKRVEKIREDLSEDEGYMLMGEPISEEAKEAILDAMEFAIRQATKINKKYIPKKYRDK